MKKKKNKATQIDAEGGSGYVRSSDPGEVADEDDDPPCPGCASIAPGDWLLCDTCLAWWHDTCVGFSVREYEGDREWLCPVCIFSPPTTSLENDGENNLPPPSAPHTAPGNSVSEAANYMPCLDESVSNDEDTAATPMTTLEE